MADLATRALCSHGCGVVRAASVAVEAAVRGTPGGRSVCGLTRPVCTLIMAATPLVRATIGPRGAAVLEPDLIDGAGAGGDFVTATIAIMTDFGIKDGNVGVMKGVIWRICPDAQIADISHMIRPQNIPEAALVLARSAPYFPHGTVHLVVVDPGVGTTRRPMAGRLGHWYYVGPDNGTITILHERARLENWTCEFVKLDRPRYWLPDVSHVFHGRDVFAPTAAHLANGVHLEELGSPFSDPVLLHLPQPVRDARGWHGEIIHIDHFGNLASNIRAEHLGEALRRKEEISVHLGASRIDGLVDTFGEAPPGTIVALLGSTGNLIVSVVNGNAASVLGVHVGDAVEALLSPKAGP